MKKFLLIFLHLVSCNFFGQESESKLLIEKILETQVLKEFEYAIAAKIDSVPFEYVIHNFINNNQRKYKSIRDSKKKIKLSRIEKNFLIEKIKNQYNENWKNDNFKREILQPNEIKKYLEKSKKNSIVYITKPILFRNNSVALTYMVNFHGDISTGGGISQFGFYKKTKEGWEKWIMLEEGIYN